MIYYKDHAGLYNIRIGKNGRILMIEVMIRKPE